MGKQKKHIVLSQQTKTKLDDLSKSKLETYEDIIKELIKNGRRKN